MKSKAYILPEIRQLLEKNRGLCEEEIDQWVTDNDNMSVCKLLELKNELMKSKEFRDVSCMTWFREEEQ